MPKYCTTKGLFQADKNICYLLELAAVFDTFQVQFLIPHKFTKLQFGPTICFTIKVSGFVFFVSSVDDDVCESSFLGWNVKIN